MIAIPSPHPDAGEDFEIGDTLTIVEAALVYAGRHPHGRFLRDGTLSDIEGFIKAAPRDSQAPSYTAFEEFMADDPGNEKGAPADPHESPGAGSLSWTIYRTLLDRITRGTLTPVITNYLEGGGIDSRATIIRTEDLIAIARERGDAGEILQSLAAQGSKLDTGAVGRPSSMPLVEEEFRRRIGSGDVRDSLAAEAKALAEWRALKHPVEPPLKAGTIEKNLRKAYMEYRQAKGAKI